MQSDNYIEYFKLPYMMGPNCLRILEELLKEYPQQYTPENLVLDLGCGSGLTSYFMVKETGATVYANDLWISEEENRKRFEAWDMQDRLIPVHEDATRLNFEKEMFDALISIDSYHYFAGKEGFFANNILPYIKSGGIALIAVPGIKNEYEGQSEKLLTPWLDDDAYMFHSAEFWQHIIGEDEAIAEVKSWEMAIFDKPWQEWFATGHKLALNDKKHFESIIKPFTTFVGIMVRKK